MRKNRLLIIYLLLGLFLFFGSYNDRIVRAQFLGKTIYFPMTFLVNEFKVIKKLREDNKNLRFQIGDLLIKIRDQETKLIKYHNSIIEFEPADSTYVFADVIGFSGDFFGRTILVSKGYRDGVRKDSPVFSSNGIVGKVIVAYNNFSVVLPINHSSFKLAVLNKNSGVQGILVADVYANIAMEYLKFSSNISVGDTVVTSNLSMVFPANYPVGHIVRLEESQDALYFRALIQPFNNIGNLQNVYILLREHRDMGSDATDLEIVNYEL